MKLDLVTVPTWRTRFVNDPSRDLCATVPMKVVLVRAHDWFDDHSEVSVEQQIEPYFEFLRPLLSQVADNTDASWWLLDSGAFMNLSAFRSVLQDSKALGGYCENSGLQPLAATLANANPTRWGPSLSGDADE